MLKLGKHSINIKKPSYLQVFSISFITALIIFLPFLIYDKGYFLFFGDFNVQQVPFYQLAHEAVKSGNILWNWNTDLGANFIASYSFYLLGSPFFWITLLFPTSFVPYLMAPLLILKIACAATTGYAFLKRFLKNPQYAVIGGLLYAFSGFSIYNIFFNHFHEAIVFFPLLLIALEETMTNNRKWVFALAVFINLTVNYFLFVGEVVFCILYFIMRLVSKEWKLTLRKFAMLAFEAVLGVGLGAILFFPSALVVLSNPRTERSINGWNALIYWDKFRPMHILTSFFFPPDLPARPNFVPDSKSQWSSIAAWLPVFGFTGVIAFLQTSKHTNWIKRTIVILLVCAFVPLLNQVFYMFNESYYARWFYMLTLLMALATMKALEDRKTNWSRAIGWSLGITLGIALPIAFLTKTPANEETGTAAEIGLMEYDDRFWIYTAIAVMSIFVTGLIVFAVHRLGKRRSYALMLTMVSLVSITYSIYFIAKGKSHSYDTNDFIIPYALNRGEDFTIPDREEDDYRIDVYKSMDNMAMFWGMKSINAFHSIVPQSIMEFYPEVGVDRGVGSRPEEDVYALRSFLSVRWLFSEIDDSDKFFDEETQQTSMPAYTYYGTENGFDVWENDCYIPIGYTFDRYISMQDFKDTATSMRHQLLLKGLVLTDEQAEKYDGILEKLESSEFRFDYGHENESSNYTNYKNDCADRNRETCENFTVTKTGFTAEIDLKKENLVFFSVPYEDGWSAYVNGKQVELEKVDIGFMAVLCPEGENYIEFKYFPELLKEGMIVSGVSVVILFTGIGIGIYRRKKKKKLYLKGFI